MTTEIQAPAEGDERGKFEAFVQRETGRTMDWHREGKTTGLEFAWACWQARAAMSNVQPKSTPKLDEWDYLRKHGKWRNGVPDWARDYKGQMNDGIAKSAVIEELRAALTAKAPAPELTPEMVRAGSEAIYHVTHCAFRPTEHELRAAWVAMFAAAPAHDDQWRHRAIRWLRDMQTAKVDSPYFSNGMFKVDCANLIDALSDPQPMGDSNG